MIAIRLTVPFACFRKAHARELVESELLPPPATCYGALLSLVGELDRERHLGARVSAGLWNAPVLNRVLRTFWQIKTKSVPQGTGNNMGPDYQELVTQAEIAIFCDSAMEAHPAEGLEGRVRLAFRDPARIERFGGWSLGESTHLINDAYLLEEKALSAPCRVFLEGGARTLTLPVWVDHVGAAGTRYAVGELKDILGMPPVERLPSVAKA